MAEATEFAKSRVNESFVKFLSMIKLIQPVGGCDPQALIANSHRVSMGQAGLMQVDLK